jgi:hypothetical protein
MNKSTSGGSLNVMVQPTPIVKGTQTNFTFGFEQKGGRVVQPHTDYDVTITKDGKRVFQASALGGGIIKGTSSIAHPNQPLHATTGSLCHFSLHLLLACPRLCNPESACRYFGCTWSYQPSLFKDE